MSKIYENLKTNFQHFRILNNVQNKIKNNMELI